jgi:hypothetical protein
VVRHGFMSNFLFQNISNVFGAPAIVKQIVEKLTPAHEDPKKRDQENLQNISAVPVDEQGQVDIPHEIVIGKTQGLFGEKRYEEMMQDIQPQFSRMAESGSFADVEKALQQVAATVKETAKRDIIAPVATAYEARKSTQSQMERQIEREIDQKFQVIHGDYVQQTKIAQVELERKRQQAETQAEVTAAETAYHDSMEDALNVLTQAVHTVTTETIQNKPSELVERMEQVKAEEEKRSVEDSVRAHLRGFARTIPSFIMAYGNGRLTLQNFDDYTEDDVFEEVTGITEADFRFLRDGGDYQDPDTGETLHFAGHLFDETVFNDSIGEFWKKKLELADYFNETQEEDIFDYIPPQKTNQIFTPRWVVQKMVDELEENNLGCFDDPHNTFADLYMKSGLYITEIVKRLFRSQRMKDLFPDDGERIRHILRNQVYGMAPTRIIYLIATNYILGFDEQLKDETSHFVQADAAKAAKENRLEQLVNQYFG